MIIFHVQPRHKTRHKGLFGILNQKTCHRCSVFHTMPFL